MASKVQRPRIYSSHYLSRMICHPVVTSVAANPRRLQKRISWGPIEMPGMLLFVDSLCFLGYLTLPTDYYYCYFCYCSPDCYCAWNCLLLGGEAGSCHCRCCWSCCCSLTGCAAGGAAPGVPAAVLALETQQIAVAHGREARTPRHTLVEPPSPHCAAPSAVSQPAETRPREVNACPLAHSKHMSG